MPSTHNTNNTCLIFVEHCALLSITWEQFNWCLVALLVGWVTSQGVGVVSNYVQWRGGGANEAAVRHSDDQRLVLFVFSCISGDI